MKKILTNTTYLSMIIGVLVAYISLLTFAFITSQLYFTIVFILNLLINFGIIVYNVVKYDTLSEKTKSLMQSGYILVTLFALILDVVVISNVWDMNVYSNVMYVTNVTMYLSVYAFLMLVIIAFNLYGVIKEYSKRQNSTNETINTKK